MSDILNSEDVSNAELKKLFNESVKFAAESQKLMAEERKLMAEQQKLIAESRKLYAEGDKLYREFTFYPFVLLISFLSAGVGIGVFLTKYLGH